MRILVIGSTGVIGRRVVPLLLQAGHTVTAVGRSDAARRSLAAAGARPVTLDIFDRHAATRAAEGHDALVNLATRIPAGPVRPFLPGAWKATDRIRREGAATLAAAARDSGVGRYVQESFAGIYEDGGDRWLDESSPVRPARYNRTVLDAERAAEAFTSGGGVGVALRFGFFYGPGDGFTATVIRAVRKGVFPLFGRPDAYTAQIHHDDAAAAVVAALGVPAGIYNVADDEPMTRRDFADALAGMLGVAPPRLLPPWMARLGGSVGEMLARSIRLSNGKLRAASEWLPRYPSADLGWRALAPVEDARPS
jgi:nucleoside-diphosphate-sugar epimerase